MADTIVPSLAGALPSGINAKSVACVAAGTVFLALSSWVSVPLYPVPVTMQTYAVLVVGALLGTRLGIVTVLTWLAEALVGLPVMAHGTGGVAVFSGFTAGYILSFPVIAAVSGWMREHGLLDRSASCFVAMLLANVLHLSMGALWLAGLTSMHQAWVNGIVPFLSGVLLKTFLATATIGLLRNRFRPTPAA